MTCMHIHDLLWRGPSSSHLSLDQIWQQNGSFMILSIQDCQYFQILKNPSNWKQGANLTLFFYLNNQYKCLLVQSWYTNHVWPHFYNWQGLVEVTPQPASTTNEDKFGKLRRQHAGALAWAWAIQQTTNSYLWRCKRYLQTWALV